jgi:hypothetical protein
METVVRPCPVKNSTTLFEAAGCKKILNGKDQTPCRNCSFRECQHESVLLGEWSPIIAPPRARPRPDHDRYCPDQSGREYKKPPGRDMKINGLDKTICVRCDQEHWKHTRFAPTKRRKIEVSSPDHIET